MLALVAPRCIEIRLWGYWVFLFIIIEALYS